RFGHSRRGSAPRRCRPGPVRPGERPRRLRGKVSNTVRTGRGGAPGRCSSGVEQLTCNQQVVGSTPTIGSRSRRNCRERYPSGQREQTVNLPANAYGGSNPPLSTRASERYRKMMTCGSSSGGRARAFQARGRGFDSRLPLHVRIPTSESLEKPREALPSAARGLGASEARRARSARALDGPPGGFAHVAQAAEHFLGKEEVTGSNPVVGSIQRGRRCAI